MHWINLEPGRRKCAKPPTPCKPWKWINPVIAAARPPASPHALDLEGG